MADNKTYRGGVKWTPKNELHTQFPSIKRKRGHFLEHYQLSLFVVVVLAAFCASCSSDDKEEVVFAATDIIAVSQSQGIADGFLQCQCDYAVLNARQSGVSVTWYDSEMDESEGDTLHFFPLNAGQHTITAVLHKDGATKLLTKTIEIKPNDGTFAVVGQTIKDAIANERMYSKLVYLDTIPQYGIVVFHIIDPTTREENDSLRYVFYEPQKKIDRIYDLDYNDRKTIIGTKLYKWKE